VTKKDEQDGSFLIIDDSVSANQLPDTAVQLFDAAPEVVTSVQEINSIPEVSFFSEPAAAVMNTTEANETTSEVTFFTEPIEDVHGDIVVVATEEADVEGSKVVSFAEESVAEVPEESAMGMVADEISEPLQKDMNILEAVAVAPTETVVEMTTNSVLEKNDIYAPVRKAIAEYDEILVSHVKIAEAKDAEIAEYNNRVAEAKAAAKKALEERKALETEMMRVKQMKELFSAQLA